MNTIKKFSAIMMAVLGMLVFASCGSDDDEVKVGAAKSIAGVYTADLTCTVMNSDSKFENETVTIKSVSDDKVNITIGQFGKAPMAVPEFTVEDVTVTGENGTYEIAAKDFSGTTESGKAYSGVLTGSFSNNTLQIKFNLKYGAMPMPMINTFNAQKK